MLFDDVNTQPEEEVTTPTEESAKQQFFLKIILNYKSHMYFEGEDQTTDQTATDTSAQPADDQATAEPTTEAPAEEGEATPAE